VGLLETLPFLGRWLILPHFPTYTPRV